MKSKKFSARVSRCIQVFLSVRSPNPATAAQAEGTGSALELGHWDFFGPWSFGLGHFPLGSSVVVFQHAADFAKGGWTKAVQVKIYFSVENARFEWQQNLPASSRRNKKDLLNHLLIQNMLLAPIRVQYKQRVPVGINNPSIHPHVIGQHALRQHFCFSLGTSLMQFP